MRVRILSAVCALLCVAVSLLLTKCADKSTDPPPDGPKDYVVYGWNPYGGNLVGYHTLTGAVDSIPLPFSDVFGLKASPDGRKLYFKRLAGVSALDVASPEIIFDLPCGDVWDIVHSPDGNMIALLSDSLIILRASDHFVLFRDTVPTTTGTFSNDSKLFYCRYGFYGDPPTLTPLACIGIDSGSILWKRSVPFALGISTMIAKDNVTLIAYQHGKLQVYDVERDTLLFDRALGRTGHDMVASPDGTRFYLTVPGDIDWPPAPYTFAVYDFPGNRMLDSVRIPYSAGGRCSASDYIPAGYMAMTPDGHLIAERVDGGMLLDYNLARPDTAKWLCTRRSMTFLTCQTKP